MEFRTALYFTEKYKKWRNDIFERDDFTCQECKKRGGDLEAHHVEDFSKVIKKNNIETVEQALGCNELWKINNGQTLCQECHNKTKKGTPKKLPRCLVGCPIYDGKEYITDRYLERVNELTYGNYDILLVDNSKTIDFAKKLKSKGVNVVKIEWEENSKKRLVMARNYLRDYALKNNYDYFFSLEQDVIPPKDIIEQLLVHDKEVVSGWYYICKGPDARPCLAQEWTLVDMKFTLNHDVMDNLARTKLMKVFLGSLGCSLIRKDVLEKIKFRYLPTFSHHDDTWFYMDCEKKEIGVYVDTSLLVAHFQDYKWGEIAKNNEKEEFEKMKIKEEKLEYKEIDIN